MKRLLLALVLTACSSKSSTPPNTPPPVGSSEQPVTGSAAEPTGSAGAGSAGAGSAGAGSAAAPAGEAPKLGDKCGEGDKCPAGQTCVSYYGIAGARGPQFKTCEIKCDKAHEETVCPKGTHCATIADGPGSVCR